MQTTTLPTDHRPANAKMQTHGFRQIHEARIRPRKSSQERQPYTLDVTGTWIAANSAGPLTMRTKVVAAGGRQALEAFARANNLPLNQ
jgi:hypothetical protein